jgi:hypothetical protein
MGFELDVAMTVRKPRRDIASVIFNPHYVSAWTDQVLEMRPLAAGPLRAGSRIARKTRFLGCRFHDVTEVLDHVPGQFLDMVTQRPLAMRLRYSLPRGRSSACRPQGTRSGCVA